MKKFVFVVPPFDGHVNPTLSIGKELLKRKHEVAWISADPRLKDKLPDGGIFLLIPHNFDEETIKKIRDERLNGASVQGIDSLKILYEVDLIPMNQFLLEGVTRFLSSYQPDIVIYDYQLFAGAVAAAKLALPYVASVTAPASIKAFDALPKLHEWENEQIINFQKQNGITSEKRIDEQAALVLVYTSRLFFGEKALPDFYHFVGPVLKERPTSYDFNWKRFESMKNRPCILVSLGTTFTHEEQQPFFQKVIEAFNEENLTVVMVSDPDLYERIPDNFMVQKRVPQLELLPHLQLVVSHAGQNTVSETLSWGIPLVLLPIAFDQSQVANEVVRLEAGIRMKFKRFKKEDLKNAVYEILGDEKYANNAKKIQASFVEAGGVDRCAHLLENLVKQ
jgi:MGT family glycosyltransferase